MNLEDLNQIAQIVGVLLIPASLVFVGLQMRQTQAIERGNAQRDLLNQTAKWWEMLVGDPATFESVREGLADYSGMSSERQARFAAMTFSFYYIAAGAFMQQRDRLISASVSESYVRYYLSIIATPGGRQFWEETGRHSNPEFCAYLSARLAAEAETLPLVTGLVPFFRFAEGEKAGVKRRGK